MSLPARTILGDLARQEATSATHPLFYTRERTHYLSRLSQQVNAESELPTVDLRRNMRVDHYLSQYNGLRQQQQRQQRIQDTLLPTNQFTSIFQQDETKKREEKRAERENKSVQETLYRNYVEEGNFYQPAERDRPLRQDEQPQTVLSLGEGKMKELYLIDLQMGRVREQQRIERAVRDRHEGCQNNALLGKLSSSIISSYMVYFDEIYALLIDELFEDEVVFLNQLEANYKLNRGGSLPPTSAAESKQTMQMMELVRSLDELCDD